MLTKNDLTRKKFKLSELKKIPSLVFTPNTKTKLPENLGTLLFLLRKIQIKNLVDKLKNEKILSELEGDQPCEERDLAITEINEKLTQIEYSRHRLHTIYSQILVHLFSTNELEPLYVQSHEAQPDLKNVLTGMYGGHIHRVQVKAAQLKDLNLEDRGIRYKNDVESFDESEIITDEQLSEYGYTLIDVIRECRRLSNYLTKRIAFIKQKNTKINEHNIIAGKIKLMAKENAVTIVDDLDCSTDEKKQPSVNNEKSQPGTKHAKPKTKSSLKTLDHDKSASKFNGSTSKGEIKLKAGTADQIAKKPINVIRKRSFILNK